MAWLLWPHLAPTWGTFWWEGSGPTGITSLAGLGCPGYVWPPAPPPGPLPFHSAIPHQHHPCACLVSKLGEVWFVS